MAVNSKKDRRVMNYQKVKVSSKQGRANIVQKSANDENQQETACDDKSDE